MTLGKDLLNPAKQSIANITYDRNSKNSEQVKRFSITDYKSLLHKLLFLQNIIKQNNNNKVIN